METSAPSVDERKRPEQPDANDHGPARNARIRIAEIQKQADRLRQRRTEQVGEDEISGKAQLRALCLRRRRNEPIDHSDESIPVKHMWTPLMTSVGMELSVSAFKNWFRRRFHGLT